MGIYSDGIVYGVKIVYKNDYPNCNLDDLYITIYEKKSTSTSGLSKEEKEDTMIIYEKVKDKKCIFYIYTNVSTTYDLDDQPFMDWTRVDREEFCERVQR